MNLKISTEDTLAIIMGGGAGTRLFPLTKDELNQRCRWPANTAW